MLKNFHYNPHSTLNFRTLNRNFVRLLFIQNQCFLTVASGSRNIKIQNMYLFTYVLDLSLKKFWVSSER